MALMEKMDVQVCPVFPCWQRTISQVDVSNVQQVLPVHVDQMDHLAKLGQADVAAHEDHPVNLVYLDVQANREMKENRAELDHLVLQDTQAKMASVEKDREDARVQLALEVRLVSQAKMARGDLMENQAIKVPMEGLGKMGDQEKMDGLDRLARPVYQDATRLIALVLLVLYSSLQRSIRSNTATTMITLRL